MVAGMRRLLDEGRAYTYRELVDLVGAGEAAFSRVFDALVSEGRVRPVLVGGSSERPCLTLATFERDLLWMAARTA